MKKQIMCILFCMLMIVSTIIPVTATTVSEKTSQPLTMGNTLYVGGSGPNNYTKIQDAVDNTSDGDTVFVYDDSSPYYENLVVNTSINLIGEERNATIIDGKDKNNVIRINCDLVTISGFTIQQSGIKSRWNWQGIFISGNSSTIQGNIIQKSSSGICITDLPHFYNPNHHRILNNVIQNNSFYGITCYIGVTNITISGNFIAKNGDCGIALVGTMNSKNSIVRNIITANGHYGIWVYGNFNNVTENTVQNHNNILRLRLAAGITIRGIGNSITRNNLINNSRRQAYQEENGDNRTEIFNIIKENNVWDGNYWGEPLSEPKRVFGRVYFYRWFLELFWLPFITYDSHPAQEPYDIPPGV